MTDYFMQVGDYIEGRLSSSAKKAFETEMSTNEELKLAVEHNDIMEAALDMLWEDDGRQVAKEAHKSAEDIDLTVDLPQKNEAKVFPLKRAIAVAASLIVLLAAGFVMMQNINTSNEEVYASHKLNPLDLEIITGGTKGESQSNKNLSLVDQAHLLIDQNKFEEASQILETIKDVEQIEKAQYLLALAYLMQVDSVKRDSVLNIIINSQKHLYKNKAEELLKDL